MSTSGTLIQGWGPWLLLLACVAATYACRALGVLLSGRVTAGDEVFKWVNCITWAILGGLLSRLILLPSGPLAAVPLSTRLVCAAFAFVSYRLFGRNPLIAIAFGVGAMILFTATGVTLF